MYSFAPSAAFRAASPEAAERDCTHGTAVGEAVPHAEFQKEGRDFLDDRLGGSGSKKAVNALRAALEEGKFVEYHEVLYANQPEESLDGFTDAHLLELAGQVEGLRGPEFNAAVKSMKYRSFVTASEEEYERAGGAKDPKGPGTPTAVINDKRIPAEYNGLLFDSDAFAELLREIHARPWEWEQTAL